MEWQGKTWPLAVLWNPLTQKNNNSQLNCLTSVWNLEPFNNNIQLLPAVQNPVTFTFYNLVYSKQFNYFSISTNKKIACGWQI
jgi:hypothetical protein